MCYIFNVPKNGEKNKKVLCFGSLYLNYVYAADPFLLDIHGDRHRYEIETPAETEIVISGESRIVRRGRILGE